MREGPAFTKVPPPHLSPPEELLELLRALDRKDYILRHGFTRKDLKPEWWSSHDIRITFPSTIDGIERLTRGDLFVMAESVQDHETLLEFVWHILAWGSGKSRRNNAERIQSCRLGAPLLWDSFTAARAGDPREAYSSLIRPGRAVVPRFGPAFFSKFLYFASEGTEPRCLVLDALVARGLYTSGWSLAPTYPTKSFSYNWYTDTYVAYCELLARWAQDLGTEPDMLERALFEHGKGIRRAPRT